MKSLPEHTVPLLQSDPNTPPSWRSVPPLPPLGLADGSGQARQQTAVRVFYNTSALFVRFDCADQDIWGTLTQRDDPIYEEEVVEIFLAPGAETPREYVEIEVSPNGVLFDAWVRNPTGERAQMDVDTSWDWPDAQWHAEKIEDENRWWAVLVLPWAGIVPSGGTVPKVWRANFYRIERPRQGTPEFSCWSPTLTDPADFHKPSRFGTLRLQE